MELPKAYDPKKVEEKIYNLWEKSGFFNPDKLPKPHKKPFSIVIPPPNITGSLHMGHALNTIIQDILIRIKRMQGFKTLWLPGTDHAGIATQNVVEKELKKEGISRHNLGREKFIERVWQWREKYGDIILDQLKKLGASCDWSRTRFTMDKEYQEAVKEAFLHYHKKGWIYQGERVINWCPRCQTSLSDLEIEYKEEQSNLWYIRYPLKNTQIYTNQNTNPHKYIVVATTRPETMLGDSAVAVNPKDKRYKDLIGKTAILPIQNREIPIIADPLIDVEFGTGAVKVTPAHDLTDFEIGLKHKLKSYKIIDESGKMTAETGKNFERLNIIECRNKVVEELKKLELSEKIEPYLHRVAKCYRCGTTIEPLPSKQWFLKMGELAKTAKKSVKNGDIKFIPKKWEKLYFDWLNNIKDWCISRQIWWGHKIPAWQCRIEIPPDKKMGFHESIVSQVFNGKISTWRLRDHNFKPNDVIAFKNSQTGEIFGYGTITKVVETTVGEIDLKDKTHYKTYKNIEELIKKTFKRHNPDYEVNKNTPVFAYTYSFRKITANDGGCGKVIISEEKPRKCPNCESTKLVPAADVLDTWFSSALWPFATLGWPASAPTFAKAMAGKKATAGKPQKGDLKTFYPTDVLITARDIINLWVARMIFSGLEFMKKKPFKDVYIHATILTKEGKRMSKSLGTGVDPLELIEKHGADATRFGIIWQETGTQDIHFGEEAIIAGKKFCNKLWNAARFVLANKPTRINTNCDSLRSLHKFTRIKSLTPADKRILAGLNKVINSVNKDLGDYHFGRALQTIYDFFWHEFCDKYIETSKTEIKNPSSQTPKILLYVLLASLKLLHPFIPFITEEIYQKLPIKNKKECLMIEGWPLP